MSPPREGQVGHHPSLHKLQCTAGRGEFAEPGQKGCRWNLWFISAVFSPAWGYLPRKIHVPGPALHPTGVLSKVTAAHIALVFCRALWCGLQGQQERTQGCEIQAGICLSSQGKDEECVSSTILQKWSLIQSQNLTSPLRDMAVWASKINAGRSQRGKVSSAQLCVEKEASVSSRDLSSKWKLAAPVLHNCFKSEPGGQLFLQVIVSSHPSNHLSSSGVCKRCNCSLDRCIYISLQTSQKNEKNHNATKSPCQ